MAMENTLDQANVTDDVNILVVDNDYRLTRLIYTQYFEKKGLKFQFSDNELDAFKKIEKGNFAIVVVNI